MKRTSRQLVGDILSVIILAFCATMLVLGLMQELAALRHGENENRDPPLPPEAAASPAADDPV